MSLIDKLEKNQRLSEDEALRLYDFELSKLKYFANKIRERKHILI